MSSMPDVRVFVVDDHDLFRRTAAAVVEATEGFTVVGSAESYEDAAGRLAEVDLVLMDVNLPGRSGIEATRMLTAEPPSPVVILLSTYEESAFEWSGCGAADYITKSAFSPARLLRSWELARE